MITLGVLGVFGVFNIDLDALLDADLGDLFGVTLAEDLWGRAFLSTRVLREVTLADARALGDGVAAILTGVPT